MKILASTFTLFLVLFLGYFYLTPKNDLKRTPGSTTESKDPQLLDDQSRMSYSQATDRLSWIEKFIEANRDSLIGRHGPESKALVVTDLLWLMAGISEFHSWKVKDINAAIETHNGDDNLFSVFLRRSQQLSDEASCKDLPLKIGMSKNFDREYHSPSLPIFHLVKKISDKKYQVILNTNYTDRGDPSSPMALEMRKRVVRCFQDANTKMMTSAGDVIEFKIVSPDKVSSLPKLERPLEVEIKIDDNLGHDSQHYSLKLGCSSIVHETLHLTGLVDEYQETRAGFTNYGCRVVPKQKTIMKDDGFYNDIFGKTVICDCSSSACKESWASMKDVVKKNLSLRPSPCADLKAEWVSAYAPQATDVPGLSQNLITIIQPPKTSGVLLTPNYFKKIISGFCYREAQAFHDCSSFAYINSEDPTCKNRPSSCSSDAFYLGE